MKPPPQPGDFLKPILPGKGNTDYERYLRTDELLSLQKPADQRNHPDEHMFQIVHQSSELLLKGAHNELERAITHLQYGDLANAARLIRRANDFLVYPLEMLHMLDGLTPYDYHLIRAGLGHGSGLQSPGFLSMLHIAPQLQEAFNGQLKKSGITLEEMYRHNQDHFSLHDVAERLLDYDTNIQAFRFHHLKLAQRIIGGNVIGTGGNPVDILKQRQEHNFFKELWDVRNQITGIVAQEEAAAAGKPKSDQPSGHGENQ
ncbi:MAG TPA: tryptophan 2,3-dioxygenase family protein [Terriglobales bacterium]|nr:tryptophan 2,3-dioxygenase family protein [Terriglobales bacterium]